MAELAIGISRTAVQLLADKVKSAFKEEAQLWQMVQRDMVFIQDELEMMQSFLSAADGHCVMNNSVARTWVRQVCDLSHQVEDCADFILHLDTRRSWWVSSSRLLPSCCKSGAEALPLDEAVAEIKLLKGRVEEVSQRNLRYSLIRDPASREAPDLMQQTTTTAGTFDILNATKNHSCFWELTRLITNEDEDLQVISVCGTRGDLGKLSIIRKAYDDSRINKDFRCYAWVKLTYPFSPHDFIGNMVAQFYANSDQQKEQGGAHLISRMMKASATELGMEFQQQVSKHRYLIVLEDVSSMAEWDAIRTYLPDMKNGSRIVLSTHQLEIASLCTGKPYQSSVWQFSDDHSVWVFFKEQNQHHLQGFLRGDKYRKRPSIIREVAGDWTNNCFLVGRDHEVDELYEMIRNCHGRETNVVSVCGTAGAGKSSLVQTVYNRYVADERNNSEMFDMFGWVSVSHPLNPKDFSRRLLSDMHMQCRESTYDERIFSSEAFESRHSLEHCRHVLRHFRCLIVIDGLQSKKDWDLILDNLPCRTSQSCIVIITTENSIATHCATQSDRVCYIKPLEYDVAHALFRKVFPFEASLNEDMSKEVKSLLSKCGGLPKQIIALAGYLCPLANNLRGIQEHEREHLTANFTHELTMAKSDSFQSIFVWMRSRFEACPQLLKRCIFYLSIFPENSNIRRRRLVRRWMAEGYSKGICSNSLEEDAEKLFDKIAALGMIQRAQAKSSAMDDDMRTAPWQVNYLFLEYIISWQKEERIFLPLEVSVLEGRSSLTTGRIGQHLSIGSSWGRDEFVFDSLDFSRLRSLTVCGEWRPFFISNKMKVLRVLDLEGSSHVKNGDLEEIGHILPRLKFLSLRGCKQVSRLPGTLGDMGQLETLDIRDTGVMELPRSIIKLHKLQYIRAGITALWVDEDGMAGGNQSRRRSPTGFWYCFKPRRQGLVCNHNGVTMPRGTRRLTSLRKLGVVDVTTAGGEVILAELHNLKQLNSLHVSGVPHTKKGEEMYLPFTGQSWNIRFPQNIMKLKLDMPKYLLRREDIQAIGKLEKMHSLRLVVEDIQGGLPNFLRCIQQERDDAGTSLDHPFGQLKVIEVATDGLRATFYESAMLEPSKLSLKMLTSLTAEELQDIGNLKGIHTLFLHFLGDQLLGELLFEGVQESETTTTCTNIFRTSAKTDYFGQLKALEIDCNRRLKVKFAQGAMRQLELLKANCLSVRSRLQLSGIQCLPSLKEVWLRGTLDDGLREDLQSQLDCHPSRPSLKLEQEPRSS